MDACRIGRIRNRYRLPNLLRQEQGRLDRVCALALEDMLETALERAAVPLHEEICIRNVHATVRLRLSRSDSDLAVVWSLALAEALAQMIRERRPGVVRYSSRHHALVDLLASVAAGDRARVWAWRQLGMWPRRDHVTGAAAAIDEALLTLAREARAAPAVLAEVARNGLLAPLLRAVNPELWERVARAALEAARASPSLAIPDAAPPPASTAIARRAIRIVGDSALIRGAAATLNLGRVDQGLGRTIAVLGTLEADPGVLLASDAQARALLGAIEAWFAAGGMSEPASISYDAHHDLPSRAPVDAGDEVATPAITIVPQDATGGSRATANASAVTRSMADRIPAARDDTHHDLPGRAPVEPDDDAATRGSPIPDVRRRATTLAGGMLFLLHLVVERGFPEAILASATLSVRSLRWVMHQLALALVPLEPRDPAALGFAGLGPTDEPPSRREPEPTEAERVAINALRARLIEALWVRLGRPDEAQDVLLDRVCRRRAEVAADPGWIELRLLLDEVSIEVRRAGLDLDPGWLPWLGVVVRFAYA